MRIKLAFCALLILIPFLSNGQSLWRKAIVITNNGDRLEGMIYDYEWDVNPTEIQYKDEGGEKKFTTDDIVEFSTDRGVKYRATETEFDGDEQALSRLPFNKEPKNVIKGKFFLRVLVDGNPALLSLNEKGRRHFFIQNSTGTTELLNRMYGIFDNPTKNELWKQQLYVITNDCQEVQRTIRGLRYSEDDLTKVFTKINVCKKSEIKANWTGEKKANLKPNVGLVVETFASHIDFAFFVSKMEKLNYGGGLFIELFDRKRPNRLSYYNELSFRSIKQTGHNIFFETGDVELQRIKLINTLRFSYPQKSTERIFWGMGFASGYRMTTKFNSAKVEKAFPDSDSEFELGLTASAGKSFSLGEKLKVNAEVRYILERWHFKDASYFNRSHNLGLNLQLYLNRNSK